MDSFAVRMSQFSITVQFLIDKRSAFDSCIQKAFFSRHLRPWYARFAEQMARAPSANFYRVVGELAKTFLDTEAALFETY